jgi:hypothetical protein
MSGVWVYRLYDAQGQLTEAPLHNLKEDFQ